MKTLYRLPGLVLTLLLLSCGGGTDVAGGGGGGVGTGGTGIVAGTVSGLGSVIVDGTRFDESQATLENRPDLVRSNALSPADLHIGQYAYLDLDAAGTPTRVRIESQLVGAVAGVNAGTGRFTLWGQPVVINTDPDRGPVTVFSGYTGMADMQPGDPVQVYGAMQASDGSTDLLRATRIEKLAAVGALPARVTGTLRQGTGTTLLLAGRPLDVSAAATAPTLTVGTAVIAVIPWTSQLPATWQASAVALLAPAAASASLRVSGAVHLLPNNRALVQGVEIDLSTLSQQDRQGLLEGGYFTVQGRSRGDDSRRADVSRIEPLPQGGRNAQLRGSITSVAGTTTFVVRGQAVDASAAQFVSGGIANLTVGTFVEVEGTQTASGVAARRVTFPGTPPERAVLELSGTVQAVDAATRVARLLARDGRTVDLVFPAGAALPAVGDAVRAEGYWDGTRLQVREIRPDNSGGGSGGEDR